MGRTPRLHASVPSPLAEAGGDLGALLGGGECTAAQLFALFRHWTPEVQAAVHLIVEQLEERGAHVDDRDEVTDNTQLHFVCKAAAIGSLDHAVAAVDSLLGRGADVNAASQHTDMAPLHYAAFFGTAPIIDALFDGRRRPDVSAPCRQFEDSTPLHLAALAGSDGAVASLLRHGASAKAVDGRGRTPLDCARQMAELSDAPRSVWESIFARLRASIRADLSVGSSPSRATARRPPAGRRGPGPGPGLGPSPRDDVDLGSGAGATNGHSHGNGSSNGHGVAHATNGWGLGGDTGLEAGFDAAAASGSSGGDVTQRFEPGTKLMVNGHVAMLRFVGPTEFADGTWLGVELPGPYGKNDGVVKGKRYFTCPPDTGLFVRPDRVLSLD